jgi:hypothetical protein
MIGILVLTLLVLTLLIASPLPRGDKQGLGAVPPGYRVLTPGGPRSDPPRSRLVDYRGNRPPP